jgi:hypothetical protein
MFLNRRKVSIEIKISLGGLKSITETTIKSNNALENTQENHSESSKQIKNA